MLLISSLFLTIAHLHFKGSTEQFCHPNYPMCYGYGWFFTFARLYYTAFMFAFIAILKPEMPKALVVSYAGFYTLDFLDFYFNYWQTPFRQDASVLLILVTVIYVWWYCWEK